MAWISYLWVERVETKTNENTNLTVQGNTPPRIKRKGRHSRNLAVILWLQVVVHVHRYSWARNHYEWSCK